MLEEYYNKETQILILPINYKSLLEDLPVKIKKIIFKNYWYEEIFSYFNQKVDNLPNSITDLIFGTLF